LLINNYIMSFKIFRKTKISQVKSAAVNLVNGCMNAGNFRLSQWNRDFPHLK